MKPRVAVTIGSALLALAAPWVAKAEPPTASGFALDRFEPSERGSDWFVLESLDLRGHKRHALGIVGDWAYKPLVIYNLDGSERAAVVRHQAFVHVGGSLVMWDRVRFAFNLPTLVYQAGDDGALGTERYSAKTGAAAGDLRVGADLRLLGSYGGVFTSAVGLQVFFPTGSRDAFSGDGKVRVIPRIIAAGDVGHFAYSGRLGFNYRAQNEAVGGSPMGSEVNVGAAAGVRAMDKKLLFGPEFYGATGVTDADAFFKKRSTPFEILFGAHYFPNPDWRVGAGVGPGLTRGYGTPELRVVASIEWFPAPKAPPPAPATPLDRDGDGVPDVDDACPDVPGVKTADSKTNGCPPPADRDGDGIVDSEDACPDVPGVKTADPKTNGCPPPADRDGDGIPDSEDACPDEPGPRDPNPKRNGCPAARVEMGQIVITQQVKFETGKATLLPSSDAPLNAVLAILKEHPEIALLSVEGHTDNRGGVALNQGLSDRRAKAVVDWLVGHHVDGKRLTSAGFGQSRPIDSNDTDEGRQNNRRVEFHIRETKEGTVPKAPAPGAPHGKGGTSGAAVGEVVPSTVVPAPQSGQVKPGLAGKPPASGAGAKK